MRKIMMLCGFVALTGCAVQDLPGSQYDAYAVRIAGYTFCHQTNQMGAHIAQAGLAQQQARLNKWRYNPVEMDRRIEEFRMAALMKDAITRDNCVQLTGEAVQATAQQNLRYAAQPTYTPAPQPTYTPAPVYVPQVNTQPTFGPQPSGGYNTYMHNTPSGIKQSRCTTTSSGVVHCF